MAQWTKTDNAAGRPNYANTADVYGVDTTEVAVAAGKVTHAGWVKVITGTGPVSGVVITTPGTLYANTDTFSGTGGGGTGLAGTIGTNGSGVITSVTITNSGSGYSSAPTVAITTSTGSGAALTASVTGRAGRQSYEVLVAMGSITGDGEDVIFPDA